MKIKRKDLGKVVKILNSFDISTEKINLNESNIKLPGYALAFIRDQLDGKSLLESNKNFKSNNIEVGGTNYVFEKHNKYYFLSRIISDDIVEEGLIKRVSLSEQHLSILKNRNKPTKNEIRRLVKKLDHKKGGFFL